MKEPIPVCFNQTASGPRILEAGAAMAAVLHAQLTFVRVQPSSGVGGYDENLFHEDLERIEELFDGAGKEGLLFVRRFFHGRDRLPAFNLLYGEPAQAILGELSANRYRLLVVGSRDDRSVGPVGTALVERSPVDVLVVKGR